MPKVALTRSIRSLLEEAKQTGLALAPVHCDAG